MLVFPDVEALSLEYLVARLAGRWPGLQVLTDENDVDWQVQDGPVVVVTASGPGNRTGLVYEQVLLGVRCYAAEKPEAARLATEVRAVLEDWSTVSGQVAGHSDNARPTYVPNGTEEYPSYWYACNLLFKATELEI